MKRLFDLDEIQDINRLPEIIKGLNIWLSREDYINNQSGSKIEHNIHCPFFSYNCNAFCGHRWKICESDSTYYCPCTLSKQGLIHPHEILEYAHDVLTELNKIKE